MTRCGVQRSRVFKIAFNAQMWVVSCLGRLSSHATDREAHWHGERESVGCMRSKALVVRLELAKAALFSGSVPMPSKRQNPLTPDT